jgi:hypothetical protein
VSLRIVTGAIVLSLVRGVAAERAIVVDAVGVPFASSELVEAIRVRVPLAGPPLHVRVTSTAAGVRVAAAGGARDVALGDRSGADAARLVALAASDLLAIDSSIAAAPADVTARVAPAAAPISADTTTSLAVLASAAAWNGVLGGLTAELAFPLGAWVIAADLGGGSSFGGQIELVDAEARLGIGRRIGPFELRLDAVAEPLFVTTGAGDFTALLGGGASVRLRIPVETMRVVIAGGADAFATQTEYRTAGADALTTPRIAPWLRLGLEVPL